MSEKRKDIDKLLEIIDKRLELVDARVTKARSDAYAVRLTDMYAIDLRDNFNRLYGEHDTLIEIKNKILELINEGE